ncbi:MAG: hypothetical protein ACJ8H8_23135, partial [Geminicoccaceae bacterium]
MRDSPAAAGQAHALIARPVLDRVSARAMAYGRRCGWLRLETVAAFDAFVLLGVFGLYLKMALLAPQWGAVARFLGKRPGEGIGVLDRLGFFASDLGLNLIVLPLVATAAVTILFRSYRVLAACVICVIGSLAYFIELRASAEVGQYISGEMVRDFVGWSMANPSLAPDYVTPASLLKLVVLIIMLAAVAWAPRAVRRGPSRSRTALRAWLAVPVAISAATVALAPLAFAVRLPHSPLNTSAVSRAVTALSAPTSGVALSPWATLDDALGTLRRLTHTAAFDPGHGLVGRERGSDLLVFMMETGPAQAYELATLAPRLPGAGRLYPHAFLSAQHYTAHPYSSDALFSVLAGTYPHGRRQLLTDLGHREVNGLLSGLPPEVGHRGVYLPSLYQIELDDHMYTTFGARTLYVADRHPGDATAERGAARAEETVRRFEATHAFDPGTRARLRDRLASDLQALEQVKADIRRTVAAGGHYGIVFFPEIGHGPW